MALSIGVLGLMWVSATLISGLMLYLLPTFYPQLPWTFYLTVSSYILLISALAIWLPLGTCIILFPTMVIPYAVGYEQIGDVLCLINTLFVLCCAPAYIYFALSAITGFTLIDKSLSLFYQAPQSYPIKYGQGALLGVGVLSLVFIPGVPALGIEILLITGFSIALRAIINTGLDTEKRYIGSSSPLDSSTYGTVQSLVSTQLEPGPARELWASGSSEPEPPSSVI